MKEDGVWDDFTWTHIATHPFAHGTPEFLPWHRWFIYVFETQLQTAANDCEMTLPYWDWEHDTDNEATAAIMDSFGNAFTGSANLNDPNISPQQRYSGCNWPLLSERGVWEGCLEREFDDRYHYWGLAQVNAMIVDYTQYGDDYAAAHGGRLESGHEVGITPEDPNNDWMVGINGFRIILEGGPHAAPHNFLGGPMPGMTSPNDPLFYLHHANVDRLWAIWQDYHGHSWQMENKEYMENYSTTDFSMYEGPNLDTLMPYERDEIQVDFSWLDGSDEYPTARQVLKLYDEEVGMQVQYIHRGNRHPIPGNFCPHPNWFKTEERRQLSGSDSLPNIPTFDGCELKLEKMDDADEQDLNRRHGRNLKTLSAAALQNFSHRQQFLLRGSQQKEQEAAIATDLSILYCQTEWNTFEDSKSRNRWNELCELLPETASLSVRLTLMALADCEERGNPMNGSHRWIENLIASVQEVQEEQNGLTLVQAEMSLECFHIPDDFDIL